MTNTTTADTGTARSGRTQLILAIVWFAFAALGLIGTWTYNLAFITTPNGLSYLQGWFANPASSSAAVDVIVTATAACVFMVVEGARLGWRRVTWIFVPLSFAVAIAFTFPLFLGLRELALRRRSRA